MTEELAHFDLQKEKELKQVLLEYTAAQLERHEKVGIVIIMYSWSIVQWYIGLSKLDLYWYVLIRVLVCVPFNILQVYIVLSICITATILFTSSFIMSAVPREVVCYEVSLWHSNITRQENHPVQYIMLQHQQMMLETQWNRHQREQEMVSQYTYKE